MNNNITNNEHFTENQENQENQDNQNNSINDANQVKDILSYFITEILNQVSVKSLEIHKHHKSLWFLEIRQKQQDYQDLDLEKLEQIQNLYLEKMLFLFEQAYYEIHESKIIVEDQYGLKISLYQTHPEIDKACNLRVFYSLCELKSLIKQRVQDFFFSLSTSNTSKKTNTSREISTQSILLILSLFDDFERLLQDQKKYLFHY